VIHSKYNNIQNNVQYPKECLRAFLMADNFAKRLKTRKELTPRNGFVNAGKRPQSSTMNPYQYILGLNSPAPWVAGRCEVVKAESTFTSADALLALSTSQGASPDLETIAYCRIGGLSRHT
jgi:hypothetical protein